MSKPLRLSRAVATVPLLMAAVTVVGCNSNQCSLGVRGAQQCSGYTSSGDFYYLEYDEDEGWFYGSLWCGGAPEPGENPDFTCGGDRGVTGQGDDVVCVSHGPSPGVPGYEIPQDRVTCG